MLSILLRLETPVPNAMYNFTDGNAQAWSGKGPKGAPLRIDAASNMFICSPLQVCKIFVSVTAVVGPEKVFSCI